MEKNSKKIKYCFDSSSFINSWSRYYPYKIFPAVWSGLELLIDQGRLVVPKEVKKEILAGNDDLKIWFNANSSCVVDIDKEQLKLVSEIVNKYPRVSSYNKPKPNHADPFVVALAKLKNIVLVTDEKPNGDKINPAIPDLCKEYKIKYCNMILFFEMEGWSF
ncbi:MAG: DUF4411 family protein [Patescibacteria group bacterium]